MKKVKFTLGLALSLLFVGANVANAQQSGFNPTLKTDAAIKESFSIKGHPTYKFVESKVEWTGTNPVLSSNPTILPDYPTTYTRKDTTVIKSNVYGYQNIYNLQSSHHSLSIKQTFNIQFAYKEGKDLRPVVKAIITVGSWYTDEEGTNAPCNSMSATGVVINDYLVPTNVSSVPDFDRKSLTATYEYSLDIMELIAKYPVYSIDFEISLNDEIGVVGSDGDGPQVGSLPETMRMVTINAGEGIETSLDVDGSKVIYVPSYKNYTFMVKSDKEIEVTCDRNFADPKYGIVVERKTSGGYNYAVTIKQIRSNCKIDIIQKVEGTGGVGPDDTGNETLSEYAVWGASGTLYVKSAAAATLSIYNVTGQLCKQTTVNGNASFPLAKGLYIVQLNGKAYKVVL